MCAASVHGLGCGGKAGAVVICFRTAIMIALIFCGFQGIADEKEISEIANRLASTKSKLLKEEKSQRKILSSLYSINKKMKSMSERRSRLTNEVLASQTQVKKTAKSIARLEQRIDKEREGLSRRLRTLYMLNGQGTMRILFGSQSGQEFDKNLKYLKILTDRDYRVIRKFEVSLRALKEQREKLKTKVEQLVRNQNRLKKQRRLLTQQQQSKSQLLKQLRKTRAQYQERMKGLRARSKVYADSSISKEVEGLLKPSFFEQKGKLLHPVVGMVTERFGVLEDSEFGFQLTHKGLFFNSSKGVEITGVFDGVVSFAGPLPGYGKAVVIDHGDHYYSIYGNAEKLAVKVGDQIESGEVVAFTGTSHRTLKPGLYFEIRHFTEAVDPAEWFKKEDIKRSQL